MAKAKLNAMVQILSGKIGNGVWVKSRDGQVVRQLVTPTNPNTPPQQAARTRLTTVSRIYKGFTANQEAAWDNYAKTVHEVDEITGKSSSPTAMNAFTQLSTKFLQATPGGTVPLTPPTSVYNGDNVTLSAVASAGKVTFTATGANGLGTKTELLLQPLASRNRNPQKKQYRSKAFVAFAVGSLSADVNVGPGYYAAAYRFVNTLTGQVTGLQQIGVHQVTFAVEAGGSRSSKKAA